MKTTASVIAFALLSGVGAYALFAWLLPELVPDAYIKVVGLFAVAGGAAGWYVAARRAEDPRARPKP